MKRLSISAKQRVKASRIIAWQAHIVHKICAELYTNPFHRGLFWEAGSDLPPRSATGYACAAYLSYRLLVRLESSKAESMIPSRSLHCAGFLQRATHFVQHSQRCLHTTRRRPWEDRTPRIDSRSRTPQCRYASDRARRALKPYSEEEKKKLQEKYTPEQIAAIEAGEKAVDLDDFLLQGALRHGQLSPDYIDDFSKIQPVVDKQPEAPEENYDPNLRFKEEDELAQDLARWMQELPDDADQVEFDKFLDNNRLMVGKEAAERNALSYVQPEIPKIDDKFNRKAAKELKEDDGKEMTPYLRRVSKQIGLPMSSIKRLRTKILVQRRVVNQTHLGKIASQYYMVVAGDGKGLLGVGEGKSQDAEEGRKAAIVNAIRNLTPIPRYEERTIYGDVKGKVGATELELFTRPPGNNKSLVCRDYALMYRLGFGIRTQSKIYEMCKCAGISDIAARVTRARNPMNTIKATLQALLSQRDPEQVARARGRKLVDVRKVYYAGKV